MVISKTGLKRGAEPESFEDGPTAKKAAVEDSDEVYLVAEGEKIKASKKMLIERADYFKLFFKGSFGDAMKTELPQHGKTAADIHLFLDLLNGKDCLTEDNIVHALEVSRFYQASGAMTTCHQWLAEDTKIGQVDKFQIADEFDLEDIKKAVLDEIPHIVQLQKIRPENLDDLEKDSQTLILEKILEFYGVKRRTEKPRVGEVEKEQEVIQAQIDALELRMEENDEIDY